MTATAGEFPVVTSVHMELVDITGEVQSAVAGSGIGNGLCMVYCPHTTGGITINEGADPAVRKDLAGALQEMLPRGFPYRHREGNSPSHLLATLTGSSVTVCIESGRLQLGTWQRIFFCEFDGPRHRTVWWKILQG